MSPEQRLFVGVIANAAQEAAGATRHGSQYRTIQESARAWFCNNGDDFRTVCDLAGLESNRVRSRVLAYLTRVHADPQSMAQAKRGNSGSRRHGTSILDIAQHAGVSQTTVSSIIKGRTGVTSHTRARVLAAIVELGYTRNVY